MDYDEMLMPAARNPVARDIREGFRQVCHSSEFRAWGKRQARRSARHAARRVLRGDSLREPQRFTGWQVS